jgi:hypothetical protein
MKKQWIAFSIPFLLTSLISRVSLQDRASAPEEESEYEIVGRVDTSFTKYQFLHIFDDIRIKQKVCEELLGEAPARGFRGAIDIKNITPEGRFSAWNWLYLADPIFLMYRG